MLLFKALAEYRENNIVDLLYKSVFCGLAIYKTQYLV